MMKVDERRSFLEVEGLLVSTVATVTTVLALARWTYTICVVT